MLEDKEFPLISYREKTEQEKRGGGIQVVISVTLFSSSFWVSWDTQGCLFC